MPKKALGFFAIWRRIYSSNDGVFLPDSNVYCLKVKLLRRIAFLNFLPSDFGFAKPLGCVFGAGITEVSRTLSSWQREDVHDPCSDHVLDIVGRVA